MMEPTGGYPSVQTTQSDSISRGEVVSMTVGVSEIGMRPLAVIIPGNSFTLTTVIEFTGELLSLSLGRSFWVSHFADRLEDGSRTTLSSESFTISATDGPASIRCTSRPFTTGDGASGADFEIPSGFASGTFRIHTHLHSTDDKQPIIAALHDTLIIEVR